MSDPDTIRTVRAYHQDTKHHTSGYAPSPGFLDWESQPDPFRRYADAPLVELPLVAGQGRCAYDELFAALPAPQALNLDSLGLFLELALGLSAWKAAGPDRWALRNNPSSGNLHPTEGYVLVWAAADGGPEPGLYHYAPRDHVLERRAALPGDVARDLHAAHPGTYGMVAFSTIPWREEWKYGARAFRYCQHDVGHALATARFAAAVNGWRLTLDAAVDDDTLAAVLGLDRDGDFGEAERELPDLIAPFGPGPLGATPDWPAIARALTDWRGGANTLSPERVAWPQVARAIAATHKGARAPIPPRNQKSVSPPTVSPTGHDACTLIRQRRSAQRMDGETGMRRDDFLRMLARTLPQAEHAPFDALPFAPAINLLLFVHGVADLDPGLYVLNRAPERFDDFRAACRADGLAWAPVAETGLDLYRLDAPADYRKTASQISCYQGIAGRGAFSAGMIGAIGPVLGELGAWGYRRLHWEAGLIGQVLYLEAEATHLRGTGIGCFFDDAVHGLLGLDTGADAPWQTLYHFTVGGALDDARLTTEPPYAHLADRA